MMKLKEPSYADFLLEVVNTEADVRRQRYLKARLQLAHLSYIKTFDQFNFGFQPSIDERQIRELRTLRFVHEASNVILLGPAGVGKTYLAVSLAETAIQSGNGAYFMTAHDLVSDLGRAYREGRLDRSQGMAATARNRVQQLQGALSGASNAGAPEETADLDGGRTGVSRGTAKPHAPGCK
jgi:DNA replication protein DnaC